uniref:HD/PDEase domain-containing protein n=1 Tax=viral metagenome TaxID=1070528 RepID=A0A6C0C8H0_9ZZZZ
MQDQGLVLQAVHFAAIAHSDQRRKNKEKSPYIIHSIEVANVLSTSGVTSAIILCAALLHDVVEDTKFTSEDIKNEFGPVISRIVDLCSDDKKLSKIARKKSQIEHAAHMAHNEEFMYTLNGEKIDVNKCAILVKLADKYSNVFGLSKDPPTFWSRDQIIGYIVWSYYCVQAMKGFNIKLDVTLERLFGDCFNHFSIDMSNSEELLNDYYALMEKIDN